MYQQPNQQMYQQQEKIEIEENKEILSSSILKNLQHSIILFIFLVLFNNNGFHNILSNIPLTINIDGDKTIFMYFILFFVIFICYFLYLTIFN